jgi:DNA-binding transcriptional ArsR family regulator
MKEGPAIAPVAALAGDPARANMLGALLAGQALTAGELAREAGVTLQTASAHLARLCDGGLITGVRQGRHRYFQLAGADVAAMLESLLLVAARAGHLRSRPGPSDLQLRKARVCYDHLAGELAVACFDGLARRDVLAVKGDAVRLTGKGALFLRDFGIDVEALKAGRRPLCRACLDWSQRRSHLAGALGAALLERMVEKKWAARVRNSRLMLFTRAGEARLREAFF